MPRKRASVNGTPTAPKAPGPITKAEAVRRALAEGIDNPTEGVALIKDRFGLDMDPNTFSSYKSQERTRRAKKGRRKRKSGKKPKQVAPPAAEQPRQTSSRSKPENIIEAVATVKQLVRRYGASTVRAMVDLFE